MKKFVYLFIIIVIFSIIFSSDSISQFYKVYGYQTLDAGEKEFVYWFTDIISSDLVYDFFGEVYPRKGLMAHSLEIEYGLSNHFTVALYFDFEKPKKGELKRVRTKAVMVRYRFYEKGSRPVDLAVYVEYILPKDEYKNSEELEFKTILEKDVKNFTFIFNPTFEKKVSGSEVSEGLEFNFAGGVYYRKSLKFQPGIEFYNRIGEIKEMRNFNEQKGYIFSTLDIFFKKHYHWHIGAGIGLSDNSDDFLFKSILSAEF